MNNRLELLRQFAEQIRKVYGAISSNILEVVEVLNSSDKTDEGLKKHIENIIASLELVEKKMMVERELAEDKGTLHLLKEEIERIRDLESYLKLAKKNANHSVITAIDRLNKSLMGLFARSS